MSEDSMLLPELYKYQYRESERAQANVEVKERLPTVTASSKRREANSTQEFF